MVLYYKLDTGSLTHIFLYLRINFEVNWGFISNKVSCLCLKKSKNVKQASDIYWNLHENDFPSVSYGLECAYISNSESLSWTFICLNTISGY